MPLQLEPMDVYAVQDLLIITANASLRSMFILGSCYFSLMGFVKYHFSN